MTIFKQAVIILIIFLFSNTYVNSKSGYIYNFQSKNISSDTLSDVINFYDIQSDTVFYRKVSEGAPILAFYITLKEKSDRKFDYFPIKSITIKDYNTDETLQVIDEQKDDLGIANIEFNDFNFDGYTDMYVYDACAILGNCFGNVYLYNKDSHKFVRSKEFDNLTTVNIDNVKREIYSLNRCCGGALYTYGIYKFINDKLTLVKEIAEDTDGDSGYIYTVKERDTKGKMKVVKKIKSKEPILMEGE
jgi:hypothetical protein